MELARDYGGLALQQAVSPGGALVLDMTLPSPSVPGKYQLEFDLVSESVTWFEDAGSTIPLVHWIEVK